MHRTLAAAGFYYLTVLGTVILSVHLGQSPQAWTITAYAISYGGFLAYFAHVAGETARERDKSVAALTLAISDLEESQRENFLLANIDQVTGLSNRKAFSDRVEQTILDASRKGRCFSFHILDLDNFKNVNDVYGHGTGDELLATVGARLARSVDDRDNVARLGGDEFAFISEDVETREEALEVSRRVISRLSRAANLSVARCTWVSRWGPPYFPITALR